MKTNKFTLLIICLCVISASCTKETELAPSPELPSSSAAKMTNSPTAKHFIGEHFGGGIVYYIDKSGKHGLIAAAADFEEPAPWSRKDTLTGATGAKDTTLGAGAGNTIKIYNAQGYPQYEADEYAALECLGFTLNGYEDWFLPSLGELNKMYQNKNIIGGFQLFSYWSSSESSVNKAWLVNFSTGSQSLQTKTASYTFRPARKF